jgi:hypothetical protein
MEQLKVKEISVKQFSFKRIADPNCSKCHGTGKRYFGRAFCNCVRIVSKTSPKTFYALTDGKKFEIVEAI